MLLMTTQTVLSDSLLGQKQKLSMMEENITYHIVFAYIKLLHNVFSIYFGLYSFKRELEMKHIGIQNQI